MYKKHTNVIQIYKKGTKCNTLNIQKLIKKLQKTYNFVWRVEEQIMNKTEIINVRLSKELLKKLDPLLQEKSFSSRSEAVRQFLREYVQEQKQRGIKKWKTQC